MSKENPLSANERLREERLKRGWSQQKLADQLGIAVVTVNRWERGKQQPTGYYRLKLTTLFEKSAAELGLVEEPAEVVALIASAETQENEHENAAEQQDPGKETLTSYYEKPSYEIPAQKPLLERRTLRQSLLSPYAQFGMPLLKRRGKILLLLVVLIVFVIVTPITFFLTHSTKTKISIKQTPSSTIPFAPPAKWTLKMDDPMTVAHHETQWNVDNICSFHTDGYYASSLGTNYCNYGESSINNFSDIAYSIDMVFYKGSMGGLVFRLANDYYYGFYITTTGKYCILWHTDDDGGDDTAMVSLQPSAAIRQGFNQKNTLSVLAQGSVLQFWINGQKVNQVNNTKYKSGTIGTFVGDPFNDTKPITTALFKNAKIWTP